MTSTRWQSQTDERQRAQCAIILVPNGGRLAQWESASLTTTRSQVQFLHRPPFLLSVPFHSLCDELAAKLER